jgi:hypothetical protein
LRLNFVAAVHLVSAPQSSVFARLVSGTFYETIVLEISYVFINTDLFELAAEFIGRPGFIVLISGGYLSYFPPDRVG